MEGRFFLEHLDFVCQRWQATAVRTRQEMILKLVYRLAIRFHHCRRRLSGEVAPATCAIKAVELPRVVSCSTLTARTAAEKLLALDQVSPTHVSGLVEIVLVIFYSQLFILHEIVHQDNSYFGKLIHFQIGIENSCWRRKKVVVVEVVKPFPLQ